MSGGAEGGTQQYDLVLAYLHDGPYNTRHCSLVELGPRSTGLTALPLAALLGSVRLLSRCDSNAANPMRVSRNCTMDIPTALGRKA